MKKIIYSLSFCLTIFFFSCDDDTVKQIEQLFNGNLTETEIVEGLKSALVVGTDTSVTTVSAVNGYYKDEIIKILLPPEADVIFQYKDEVSQALSLIGLGEDYIDNKIEETVLTINRSAEYAAVKAQPIFVDAITSMSISDAVNILNGEDNAATEYLKTNTYDSLTNAFAPDINEALDKPIGTKGISANQAWETLVTEYNNLVSNPIVSTLLNLEPVQETNLGTYVTHKALDGLYYKVALEEKDIRTDVTARVNEILQKVFGTLDEEETQK